MLDGSWLTCLNGGGPYSFASSLFSDFARYAESCGGVGYRFEKPEELLPAFQQAVRQKQPCIIDVIVDAEEAPMPGTITFAQAAGYTKHMLKALFEEGKLDLPIDTPK